MKTNLEPTVLETREGKEANDILRSCVHCGFCTATCPTYQLLGDELDSPRGRIYLIKELLEGQKPTEATQTVLNPNWRIAPSISTKPCQKASTPK